MDNCLNDRFYTIDKHMSALLCLNAKPPELNSLLQKPNVSNDPNLLNELLWILLLNQEGMTAHSKLWN